MFCENSIYLYGLHLQATDYKHKNGGSKLKERIKEWQEITFRTSQVELLKRKVEIFLLVKLRSWIQSIGMGIITNAKYKLSLIDSSYELIQFMSHTLLESIQFEF